MIYGYVRVSTSLQTVENQRFEIENFAENNNIKIEKWLCETISSSESLNKRKLGNLLAKVSTGDLIIVSELSRLGRNLLQIMGILNHCMNTGAEIWTIKDNYRLRDDIESKVLAFAFGLSAEIERNLISQRTKESLARLRAEGIKLGRPLGSKNKKLKLFGYYQRIKTLQNKGFSKYAIAKKLKVHRATLERFLLENE